MDPREQRLRDIDETLAAIEEDRTFRPSRMPPPPVDTGDLGAVDHALARLGAGVAAPSPVGEGRLPVAPPKAINGRSPEPAGLDKKSLLALFGEDPDDPDEASVVTHHPDPAVAVPASRSSRPAIRSVKVATFPPPPDSEPPVIAAPDGPVTVEPATVEPVTVDPGSVEAASAEPATVEAAATADDRPPTPLPRAPWDPPTDRPPESDPRELTRGGLPDASSLWPSARSSAPAHRRSTPPPPPPQAMTVTAPPPAPPPDAFGEARPTPLRPAAVEEARFAAEEGDDLGMELDDLLIIDEPSAPAPIPAPPADAVSVPPPPMGPAPAEPTQYEDALDDLLHATDGEASSSRDYAAAAARFASGAPGGPDPLSDEDDLIIADEILSEDSVARSVSFAPDDTGVGIEAVDVAPPAVRRDQTDFTLDIVTETEDEDPDPEEPERKGFFSRIFGKK